MVNACLKSFKHDGSSHRLWSFLYFIKEDHEYYYLCAYRAKVIEEDGREWRAPEGALYILSKKHFFNVIVMFKKDNEIEYYVNLASPSKRINENEYAFIDYDLDLKRSSNKQVKELDWGEYGSNSKKYSYSKELKFVIESTLKELKEAILKEEPPFNDKENKKLYDNFMDYLKNHEFGKKVRLWNSYVKLKTKPRT